MPSPSNRAPRWRSLAPAVVATLLLLAAAVGVDRVVERALRAEQRADRARELAGYAAALERNLAAHELLTTALVAWARAHPDAIEEVAAAAPSEAGPLDDPDAFQTYARPLLAGAPAVRALNFLEGTVIQAVYPPAENAPAKGLDLAKHPNPAPVTALRAAQVGEDVTLAGPLPLAQGGRGLLLFQRVRPGTAEHPTLTAEVVVDVDDLIAHTGLLNLAGPLALSLTDGGGAAVLDGPAPEAPVTAEVAVPGGTWTLAAAPHGGWSGATDTSRGALRLALAGLAALGGLLVYRNREEDHRLRRLVEERTARLEAVNRDLETASRFQEAALEAGSVGVWSWHIPSSSITRRGHARSGPPAPSTLPLHAVYGRVHPDDQALMLDALEQARTTGRLSVEVRELGDAGGWEWVRVEGRAVEHDAEGAPVRVLGASANVTRLKQLEADLLHSSRVELMGRLASGVVHDINNALTVVLGTLELGLLDPQASPARLRLAATDAADGARYAALLTRQMLTFARKDGAAPTVFVWDGLVEEAGAFLSRVLGKGVSFEVALSADDVRVRLDRTQAMQILANLATNARDAMEGRGRLRLATRRVCDEETGCAVVVTEIADTGPGIPAEVQDAVFEAFVTTKGAGAGTGLGLSTSLRIAREAGGDLSFSTSPDGTTFSLTLPVVEAPPP